ncbi:hypothetical protein [Nocardia africana]|uniref:Uncharacterized protein n=1 Tax=Nocardia africana TaxID=134964 RepID=A0A379X5N6_9NOCA|nr:hypothetical protein [Nocardia africana]MCC3318393.1 hypothetical protein [Nocardia africana]SUH72027.1 Uncharacterised protein [Nocardia africana]
MQMHLVIEFPELPPLHFRADAGAARAFRAEMARWHRHVSIRLDDAVLPTMRPLPCHRLFEKT